MTAPLHEWIEGLGVIEIISSRVQSDTISYVKNGAPGSFELRTQQAVLRGRARAKGVLSVQDCDVSLPRDVQGYAPGFYTVSSRALSVSDRGRLGFGRDVVLQPVPVEVLDLVADLGGSGS
jgi:hypothetical protein